MREAKKISNLPDVALAFFRGSHPTKKGRQGETSSLAGTIEVTGYSFSEVFLARFRLFNIWKLLWDFDLLVVKSSSCFKQDFVLYQTHTGSTRGMRYIL